VERGPPRGSRYGSALHPGQVYNWRLFEQSGRRVWVRTRWIADCRDRLEEQLAERKTEPNSGLGKAIRYMPRHWLPLTLFLREPGAQIANNLVERILKKGHLASEKLTVLQDAEWRQSRRPVHESDPYLRVGRSQSVRVPDPVAAARRRAEATPIGVDALELPRNAGPTRYAHSRVIECVLTGRRG
jgi:Transposase IS66 family